MALDGLQYRGEGELQVEEGTKRSDQLRSTIVRKVCGGVPMERLAV